MYHEASVATSTASTSAFSKAALLPYFICILAALFYLYEFILQVSPGVMTNQLMRDIGLNAASLGVMSAFYYYAYTPMQFPAGLLYDKYGPRLLITVAVLICAAGAFFFGLTNSVVLASAGRFLMGIGSAFSFIGALVLVSRWFPPKYFALLAGIVQLMSSIGAMTGEVPLAIVLERYGWRHTLLVLSGIGVLLAIAVWMVVRDHPPGAKVVTATTQPGEMKRLLCVLGNRMHWIVAFYAFTTWAPIAAFAALWGIPFLATMYHVDIKTASGACSMIWLGIGIGSPLIGWCSDHIGKRRLPLICCSSLALLSSLAVVYIPNLPWNIMCVLLFLFGFAASSQALSFGLVKDISNSSVVGSAIGFNNMAVVAGGALFQPLVGIILHMRWDGQMAGNIPVYQISDYRWALLILPICSILGILISVFRLPETRCQHLQSNHHHG